MRIMGSYILELHCNDFHRCFYKILSCNHLFASQFLPIYYYVENRCHKRCYEDVLHVAFPNQTHQPPFPEKSSDRTNWFIFGDIFYGRAVVILRCLYKYREIYSHIILETACPFLSLQAWTQVAISVMNDYTLTGRLGQSWVRLSVW